MGCLRALVLFQGLLRWLANLYASSTHGRCGSGVRILHIGVGRVWGDTRLFPALVCWRRGICVRGFPARV